MKTARLIAALTLLAPAVTLASQADPQDIAFARDSETAVVILTDAHLGCKGIQQAYYVMDRGADGKPAVTSSGCYFGYGSAVMGQDVSGGAHRWPLDDFKMTEYAQAKHLKIPMAHN
jgi:hypothetical protein